LPVSDEFVLAEDPDPFPALLPALLPEAHADSRATIKRAYKPSTNPFFFLNFIPYIPLCN
jgi:hypothetical protein